MAVKSAPYYWLVCDGCGKRVEYDGEYCALDNVSDAIRFSLEMEWSTDGTKSHCSDCPALIECEMCGKPAGDLAGERDYQCQTCWDARDG